MRKIILMCVSISLFFPFSRNADAAPMMAPLPAPMMTPPPPAHTMASSSTPPNNITQGDQVYDGSVSGFRQYLESMRSESDANEKIYQKLNPKLNSLESQQMWGNIAMWGGIGVGSALMTIGFKAENVGLISASFGFFLGGMLSSWLIKPGRSELLDFMNQHNRMNKNAPLKWSLGFMPTVESPGLLSTLAVNF